MIYYTTKAEYYLQEGKQITLIPSVEGKNTPPNKKTREASSKEGQHSMWEQPLPICRTACLPLLPPLLFVLQMEIHSLSFFLQDTFGGCILVSGLSNCVKFKPQVSDEKAKRKCLNPNL